MTTAAAITVVLLLAMLVSLLLALVSVATAVLKRLDALVALWTHAVETARLEQRDQRDRSKPAQWPASPSGRAH